MEKAVPFLRLKIDTREQKPLEFKDGIFDEIVEEGLPYGDYWSEIDGKELPLIFERKSLGDLFGTMTNGYERWKKMVAKAQEAGAIINLLVEGSLEEVFIGFKHSQFSGDSMLKKLAMLKVRHNIETHFFNSRREMARYIEDIYSAIKRNYRSERRK